MQIGFGLRFELGFERSGFAKKIGFERRFERSTSVVKIGFERVSDAFGTRHKTPGTPLRKLPPTSRMNYKNFEKMTTSKKNVNAKNFPNNILLVSSISWGRGKSLKIIF